MIKINAKKGFSMIEMLISMVVASMVIIGVYSFLTSSQRSFTLVQANDGINRSMQMINKNITDFMHQAGFRNFRRVYERVTFKRETYEFGSNTVDFAYNSFLGSASGEITNNHRRNHIYVRYFGSSVEDDLNKNVTNEVENGRMYDCRGNFISNKQMAVVHLFIGADGLICEQRIVTFDDSVSVVQKEISDVDTVLINPNISEMMFAFRSDGDAEFHLAGEMDPDSSDKGINFTTVNAIRYGFITKQNTHQRVNSIAENLEYHILGMDAQSEEGEATSDKVVIPQTESESRNDLYSLISGVVYMRNRFVE